MLPDTPRAAAHITSRPSELSPYEPRTPMTANEIMRYVRQWHQQIGDMPSKQVGPEICQIHSEMQHVIHQYKPRFKPPHS